MGIRKYPLVNEQIYHIYAKSIAEYKIFKSNTDFLRMEELLNYYKFEQSIKFYVYQNLQDKKKLVLSEGLLVEIVAYCIMPTHIHLILYQKHDFGISNFMEKILKSYALYFNNKYKRKGPLWAGRFLNVLIKTDEQLLHLTRYIHLNPVTAYLVERPEDWDFSSYREYIGNKKNNCICKWNDFLEINVEDYKKFVEERKDYQRELAKIKNLILE
ncbi:MAG: transposase [Candidatus Omnitrophica bacterium]|nr:transposase [Candidatus Omnitrophota bacterium]